MPSFIVADQEIRCPHCGGNEFAEGRAQLNTPLLSFFDLDWANRTAHVLTCLGCSRLEWFLEPPRRAGEPIPVDPFAERLFDPKRL